MKKRLTSLVLSLCLAFALVIPATAAPVVEAEQNGTARITRAVAVQCTGTKTCKLGNQTVTLSYTCTSTVYVNDTNDQISYMAPVKMTVSGIPSGMTSKGYTASSTDYNTDGNGTAEQRGTLTVAVSGRGDWYVYFNAQASINSNGTVSFGVV